MEMLMARLDAPISPFRLQRRVLIGLDGDSVFAKAVDVHAPDIEIGVLCAVDWHSAGITVPESGRAAAIWRHPVHRHDASDLDLRALRPTLHFVGHYQEPPLT